MGKNNKTMLVLIGVLVAILAVLVVVVLVMSGKNADTKPTTPTSAPTQAPTQLPTQPPTLPPTEPPTEPPIVKQSTATIGVTGDVLYHDNVIASGYNSATGTFNYDMMHEFWKSYVEGVDYAVANLEGTLIQKNTGSGLLGYHGYPLFNAPDAVAEALKNAGFDMMLTANNHAYDSFHDGLIRTQEAVRDMGLDWIGTRLNPEDKAYTVKDINGIKIGMVNYTYNTAQNADGSIGLNGIGVTVADSALINTFNYWQLDSFYAKLGEQMEAMRAEGAEAIVLYIHWGDEYQIQENSHQRKMAQALCDMGIDVIVGNHAHVPQPMELLTNSQDESKKTLCIYSTGNAISNIYQTTKFPKNTEDGMFFTFTFAKYSDGTVVLESTDVLPTWLDRIDEATWTYHYHVLPLDRTVEDWQATMGLSDQTLTECKNSYDRTMGIVGAGLEEANAYYAQHQQEVEAALGVKNDG